MRIKNKVLFFSLIFFGFFQSAPIFCSDSHGWKVIESSHCTIFYPAQKEYAAQETLGYLNYYADFVRDLIGAPDAFKIRIVLQDSGLYSSGYFNSLMDKISLFSYPPNPSTSIGAYESWFREVTVHEFIHFRQMTYSSGLSHGLVGLFGNLFSPNLYQALWLVEGVAVYGESQMSPYEGRLNLGEYDALMAMHTLSGQTITPLSASYYYDQFPSGQYYLWGADFVRYLTETYSEKSIAQYFSLYSGHIPGIMVGAVFPAFGMDLIAKKVFDKDFPQLFSDWQIDRQNRYQQWQFPGTVLTPSNLIVTQKGLYADDHETLYFSQANRVINGPYDYTHLYSIHTQSAPLIEATSRVLSRIVRSGDNLYYLQEEVKFGFNNVDDRGYGLVSQLVAYNERTHQRTALFVNEIMDFTIDQNRILYLVPRKDAYGTEIWQYDFQSHQRLWVTSQQIKEIVASDNTVWVVSKPMFGSWDIQQWDWAGQQLIPVVTTPWHEMNLKLKDGYLYFTANYQHQINSYRYHIASKTVEKLSQSHYAAEGIVLGDQLYFLSLTPQGKKVFSHPSAPVSYAIPSASVRVSMPIFEQNIQGRSATEASLAQLLHPPIRFFPALAMGEDGIGFNRYALTISSSKGLDFFWTTTVPRMPVQLVVANQFNPTTVTREWILSLDTFLYQSLITPLSYVQPTLYTNFSEWNPGIRFGWQFYRMRGNLFLQTALSVPFGLNVASASRYLYDEGSLTVLFNAFRYFRKSVLMHGLFVDSLFPISGLGMETQFTHRLLKVRNGLWNPNFFIGDLFGSVFADVYQFDRPIYSAGFELSAEMGAAFHAQLIPKLGIAYTSLGTLIFFELNSGID